MIIIAIKQDSAIRPHDVKVVRGAECGSDHRMVKSPVRIRYYKQTNYQVQDNKMEPGKRYKIDRLKNESTRFLYKLCLAQKVNVQFTERAEEMYETLKSKMHEAALVALGSKEINNKFNNSWWTGELAEIINRREEKTVIEVVEYKG